MATPQTSLTQIGKLLAAMRPQVEKCLAICKHHFKDKITEAPSQTLRSLQSVEAITIYLEGFPKLTGQSLALTAQGSILIGIRQVLKDFLAVRRAVQMLEFYSICKEYNPQILSTANFKEALASCESMVEPHDSETAETKP